MEINIKEIFECADIKRIREFILGGSMIKDNYSGTYQERLARDSEDIIYALKRLSKDRDDDEKFDRVMNDLIIALSAYRDVFLEIGMKIGARLLFQMLYDNE